MVYWPNEAKECARDFQETANFWPKFLNNDSFHNTAHIAVKYVTFG